jgi:predicted transport protein
MAMIARLPEQTGRTLDEWVALVATSGATAHAKIVALLKSEHGVSHGYANLIAHKALRSDAASSGSGADLVTAQYSGARAGIKPIYDAIISQVRAFGDDVEIAPKKTYVSLRRAKQFALLQPAASRMDVGIKLQGEAPTERLEASGSFNSMVTHRVRVGSVSEVDAQLIDWMHHAYDRA